jgi:transcriptional regulator with XRE-family HTH domain
MSKALSKSVLETIREYTKDPQKEQALKTIDLELDLCDRMVEMREDAGLTQRELGTRLEFTQGYVAKMENGGFDSCGVGTLRTFALALGYDIDLNHLFTPIEGYKWPCYVPKVTVVANPNEIPSSVAVQNVLAGLQNIARCDKEKLVA